MAKCYDTSVRETNRGDIEETNLYPWTFLFPEERSANRELETLVCRGC